jgi:hypothetical protein
LALELAENREAAIDLLERLQHRDDARCNTQFEHGLYDSVSRLECERRATLGLYRGIPLTKVLDTGLQRWTA